MNNRLTVKDLISGTRRGLMKRMEYELVPVMMSTVRIADELSQAFKTLSVNL